MKQALSGMMFACITATITASCVGVQKETAAPAAAPPVQPATPVERVAAQRLTDPLILVKKIDIPNVRGRLDHMALDRAGQKMYVAALSHNTIEVIDLAAGQRINEITGLMEPQGVIFLPSANRIYVTNGARANVQIINAATLETEKKIKTRPDPDNMRLDETSHRLYVGEGTGAGGALTVIDTTANEPIATVGLDEHPEAFQLESSGPRIFINVPNAHQVEVVDRDQGKVVAKWKLDQEGWNFPMALDEEHHRLFVACRRPGKLVVIDTRTGKTIAVTNCDEDADDIVLDEQASRLYIACGAGTLDIFSIAPGADHTAPAPPQWIRSIPTRIGARTCYWDSQARLLYLAVPRLSSDAPAGLWIYRPVTE